MKTLLEQFKELYKDQIKTNGDGEYIKFNNYYYFFSSTCMFYNTLNDNLKYEEDIFYNEDEEEAYKNEILPIREKIILKNKLELNLKEKTKEKLKKI